MMENRNFSIPSSRAMAIWIYLVLINTTSFVFLSKIRKFMLQYIAVGFIYYSRKFSYMPAIISSRCDRPYAISNSPENSTLIKIQARPEYPERIKTPLRKGRSWTRAQAGQGHPRTDPGHDGGMATKPHGHEQSRRCIPPPRQSEAGKRDMRKIQACRNDQRGKEHNHASDNKDVFFCWEVAREGHDPHRRDVTTDLCHPICMPLE
ncbi:hypothetical protein RAA17_12455 [Komagataeibacter rhaeticus]|nr:hypothetical protein [Komagataeibacter rhaeticus]